jgi:ADP-ribosyl-[dinitrogen reductase] hydrolase
VLVDACRLLAGMIAAALTGSPREAVLAVASCATALPLRDDVRSMASEWLEPRQLRRKPYQDVLGALDRAVRAFMRSRDFDDGLDRVLGGRAQDRDAVAATYGALAGAWYGEAAIGPTLRARAAGLDRAGQLAERLYQHGSAVRGGVE